MSRLALTLLTLAAGVSPAGDHLPPAVRGVPGPGSKPADAVIRGPAGPSEIVVTTTSRVAGAVHSLTWGGKEFLDSTDHGRQMQSACAFGDRDWPRFWAEQYNPTEAGAARDHAGPRSSSQVLGFQAAGNRLDAVTRMAFWLAPGEKSEGRYPALNTTGISNILLTKQVTVGPKGFPHALEYNVTFSIPPTEPKHTLGQFEALTGYMPGEFDTFWTFDPPTGRLAPLAAAPGIGGEQGKPVVFSTRDKLYAMGVWSPDQPSRGHAGSGYGRFQFPGAKVVKWNCVFRVGDPAGLKPGNYSYRVFVAVGSLDNVRDTLAGLSRRFGRPASR